VEWGCILSTSPKRGVHAEAPGVSSRRLAPVPAVLDARWIKKEKKIFTVPGLRPGTRVYRGSADNGKLAVRFLALRIGEGDRG